MLTIENPCLREQVSSKITYSKRVSNDTVTQRCIQNALLSSHEVQTMTLAI